MSNAGKATKLTPTSLETKTYTVTKLLDLIRTGRVRVPYFQRRFRWQDEDRRLLFDSLQRGFPAGTLLLAQGAAPAGQVVLGGFTADADSAADALWVVDGQQRLSTLAMALLDGSPGAYRPIFFDLQTDEFVLGPRKRTPPPHWLPTHVLASSALLNKWLREATLPDELSDRADQIASRVRDYHLPAYLVPFSVEYEGVVKAMFARMNRNSRALRTDEVFEALHATMDGGKPIDRVQKELTQAGFGEIDASVIERAALAVAGKLPGAKLVQVITSEEVPALFARVSKALVRTVEFLAEDCEVPHVKWLPYAGALATLAKLFDRHPALHERNRELLKRWFWRGNLSSDHKTDNRTDTRRWQAIGDDQHQSVQRLLKLAPGVDLAAAGDTPLQLYNRSTARTRIELAVLASLEPRWLTGEDPGAPIALGAFIDQEAELPMRLPDLGDTLAGYLLHPTFDLDDVRARRPDPKALASHCLDGQMLDALLAGNTEAFRARRAGALGEILKATLREWTAIAEADHDRLPLDAYFDAESA